MLESHIGSATRRLCDPLMVSLEDFSRGFASFILQAFSFTPEDNRFLPLGVSKTPLYCLGLLEMSGRYTSRKRIWNHFGFRHYRTGSSSVLVHESNHLLKLRRTRRHGNPSKPKICLRARLWQVAVASPSLVISVLLRSVTPLPI
jgi:hypothetical protein